MNPINIIFERRFKVRVPKIALYSDAEIEMFGTHIEKINGKVNEDALLNPTVAMLTVAEMLEIYKDGYSIALIDREDTKLIYDAIETHLAKWKDLEFISPNVSTDIPKDDLILLDKFAGEIFENNKRKIINASVNDRPNYGGNIQLMSPVKQVKQQEINYDIERESNVKDLMIKSKYNLNDLLKDI